MNVSVDWGGSETSRVLFLLLITGSKFHLIILFLHIEIM